MIFCSHRKGEYLTSHWFPLWLVKLPRVVKEDRPNCRLGLITSFTFPYFVSFHLDSGLWKPGKCHEDLLLLVEVPAGDGKDDSDHPEEKRCEENKQTPAG